MDSRREHFDDLFTQIRLPLLGRKYLETTVRNETLVQSSHQCLSLCNEAILQCNATPFQRLHVNNILPRQSNKNQIGFIYAISLNKIEWYDSIYDKWSVAENFNVEQEIGHSDFVAVALDKKIYFTRPLDSHVKIYDPLTNSLEDKVSTNERRRGIFCLNESTCVHDNCIYFIGGTTPRKGGAIKYVERYNVSESRWEQMPPMSQVRYQCAAVALNGFIYAIGGQNNDQAIRSVSI